MLEGEVGLAIIAVCGILVVLFISATVFASRYRKVGPNQALVVSGRRHTVVNPVTGKREVVGFHIVKAGGAFIWPVVEQVQVLSLEIMTIDVSSNTRTKDDVRVMVNGVAQVKIAGNDLSLRTAAENLLSKSVAEIKEIAQDILLGHIWALIGTMTMREIDDDRDFFAQKVLQVSAVDMANLGLDTVSLNIRDIRKA
jgi:flotillin